jgi:hypothetical protein
MTLTYWRLVADSVVDIAQVGGLVYVARLFVPVLERHDQLKDGNQ